MNDNEIIKALGSELKNTELGYEGFLGRGNYPNGKFQGITIFQECLIDLINRQKAEIDELQMKNAQQGCYLSHMDMIYEEAQAKIKRLRSENRILSENADNAFQEGLNEARELYSNEVKNEIKAEAIKEFVERLKEKKMQSTMDRRICTCEMIDNLVAEMTEGKE